MRVLCTAGNALRDDVSEEVWDSLLHVLVWRYEVNDEGLPAI